MDNLRQNPKNFYKTFKPFLDRKDKGDGSRDIHLNIDGNLVKDQNGVTEHLVEYFSTMGSGIGGDNVESLIESDFKEHSSLKLISTMMNATKNSFCFRPVSYHEVSDAMDKIEAGKAAGYDGIQPRMLKLMAEELASSLTTIFNSSMKQGEWITAWKRGEWIPVFKNDDRREVKNYRPVTVPPAVDKIYEKLLSKQITEYMDPKLSHCLSAYRKNNGCESTILRLVENWKKTWMAKKVVGVLSSDMSKAFDSLCPQLLIKKLESYHFSDNALNLVRSYFSQRKNRIRLESVTSQWRDVVRSCPQGSTFGPLLWNVFQNDLTQATVETDISMYADDHQIFSSDHSIGRVEKKLLHDGSKITK